MIEYTKDAERIISNPASLLDDSVNDTVLYQDEEFCIAVSENDQVFYVTRRVVIIDGNNLPVDDNEENVYTELYYIYKDYSLLDKTEKDVLFATMKESIVKNYVIKYPYFCDQNYRIIAEDENVEKYTKYILQHNDGHSLNAAGVFNGIDESGHEIFKTLVLLFAVQQADFFDERIITAFFNNYSVTSYLMSGRTYKKNYLQEIFSLDDLTTVKNNNSYLVINYFDTEEYLMLNNVLYGWATDKTSLSVCYKDYDLYSTLFTEKIGTKFISESCYELLALYKTEPEEIHSKEDRLLRSLSKKVFDGIQNVTSAEFSCYINATNVFYIVSDINLNILNDLSKADQLIDQIVSLEDYVNKIRSYRKDSLSVTDEQIRNFIESAIDTSVSTYASKDQNHNMGKNLLAQNLYPLFYLFYGICDDEDVLEDVIEYAVRVFLCDPSISEHSTALYSERMFKFVQILGQDDKNVLPFSLMYELYYVNDDLEAA